MLVRRVPLVRQHQSRGPHRLQIPMSTAVAAPAPAHAVCAECVPLAPALQPGWGMIHACPGT